MAGKANRRGFITLLAAPLAMAILMALIWSTEFVTELENVTVDRRFKERADTDPPADPRITLVGISDYSLQKIGRWEEWSRARHSEFVEAATYRPPHTLAFDFFFSERSISDPDGDFIFADTLSLFPSAVTGMQVVANDEKDLTPTKTYMGATEPITSIEGDITNVYGGNYANAPYAYLSDSTWTGAVNCPPSKADNMRRFIPLIVRLGDTIYPSFVLQIMMRLEESSPEDISIELGESITIPKANGDSWVVPINEKGMMRINYRNTERLTIYDYAKVGEELGKFATTGEWHKDLPAFENQIVIVGQAAEGLQDLGPTPYQPQDPLFRVQATALSNILQSDYLIVAPKGITIGIWLIVAWLTLFLLRKAPVALEVAIPFLILVAYVFISFYLFESGSLLIPIVLPVAGFVLIHSTAIGDRLFLELQEKRYIKGVFGSYVSPEVVSQIIDSGELPKLGGEKVDISILFSDIQGFSTFSEQLEPEELVDLMVEYLSAMTDIITDDGGTLDKYIGDAIDAMYGAPLSLDGHAYKAVVSTIRMQEKQIELCERWKTEGRRELVQNMRTRIGLNTGPAVVGNMGSVTRFNYTMMGDNVNLGARCESGAKAYGAYTMITDATRTAATEIKDDITYRYLDQIVVQGRTLPVKVHEVMGRKADIDKDTQECIDLYSQGYETYLQCRWDEAIDLFEKASRLEPFQPDRDYGVKTNPSRVMITRCGVMKVDPPPSDWDGVFRMTSK